MSIGCIGRRCKSVVRGIALPAHATVLAVVSICEFNLLVRPDLTSAKVALSMSGQIEPGPDDVVVVP